MAKRYLRFLQSQAPFIRPAKFGFYNWCTSYLGWNVETELKMLARVAPAGVALDIGGNWGQSIFGLKRYAKPELIVSFEPNPILSTRLQRKFAGHADVRVEACALGEITGTFDLFVPRYQGYVYDGLASLDEKTAREWLNPSRMAWFDPGKLKVDRHTVEVRPLDAFDLKPAVAKIDVQGLELAVVKGGLNTFQRYRPITIVERPEPDLVKLFSELGMLPYRWDGTRLLPGDTEGLNTVFLHPDKKALFD